jgi:hypothetical protein
VRPDDLSRNDTQDQPTKPQVFDGGGALQILPICPLIRHLAAGELGVHPTTFTPLTSVKSGLPLKAES